MISLVDLVANNVETLRIYSKCYLGKEFTKLIYRNPLMILYQTINHFTLCNDCVCGPLT